MDAYIGEIRLFTGNFAPMGWFTCEGQLLPINQYQAMFSILGTTYGGDGHNTFKLPDYRGAFPTQCSNIGGSHPGGTYTLGQTGGAQNTTITSANMPPHTHTIIKGAGTNLTGSVAVNTTIQVSNSDAGATAIPSNGNVLSAVADLGGSGGAGIYSTNTPNTSISGGASQVTNTLSFDPTGLTMTPYGTGSSPLSTVPNFVALQFIIAWSGEYPSRP